MDCYSEIDVDMHPIWICLCGTPKCWKGKFVGQISPRGLQQVDEGMGVGSLPYGGIVKGRELVGNDEKSILGAE
nr:hypothetical protein Iba_chr01aCG20630 [Ipomoea batatas]GMC54587.1 hypothetical protein Iba_chr01dCG17520 [Ipomoea batatas]